MLILDGPISDISEGGILGIDGPVTLSGNNTYSGGTFFTGVGNAEILVASGSALGTGAVTVQDSAVLAPSGGAISLGNDFSLSATLTLGQSGNSNLLTLTGVVSGNYGLTIVGPVELSNTNTYTGGTFIEDATVIIANSSSFGTGPVQLSNATVTENYASPSFLDLTGDSASGIGLVSGATLTLNTDATSDYYDYSGSISGDATNQVDVAGTGVQYLGGSSTYAGGTTVESGRLIAGSNTALGTGTVTVDSGAGLGVANPTVLTNPITLMPGAGVGGDGTFSPVGGLSISGSGTKISPGSGGVFAPYVANLSFGTALTFGSGGVYVFDVQDANGPAGTGYDTLTSVGAPGTLTITATPGTPFTIAVESVTPGGYGTLGPAVNFNSSLSYSWTLVSAYSITGFNSADFTIDLSGFQNSFGGGSFVVGESGNNLTLNFTPVPEPSTWILMVAGLAAVCVRFRRPRRA
jgi:autotransporter-associated beta strand protein